MAMYDLNYTGSTQDDQNYVAFLMLLFSTARTRRVNFEVMWEESAALCWPEYRNSFSFGHNRAPGIKYTEFQIDTTGSIASHRFMAIADTIVTPHTQVWSYQKCSNSELWKDRSVKLYYAAKSKALWDLRYDPWANFTGQNQQNWQQLGVFGNMGMWIDEFDSNPGPMHRGLRYMSTGPGEMYVLRNHQGRPNGLIRHFRWTARQAYGKWPDKLPAVLKAALEKSDNYTMWDFLQFVLPNTEYDPAQVFHPVKGKPWISVYVCVAGYCIMEQGGYRTFPWSCGAYMMAPEEEYGRGPAQMVLPELKTLNSEKAMFLRQGHKAADPAYLLADDGLVTLKTAPRSFNYGGLSAQGAVLARPLETGQIQITEEMLTMSAKTVDDAFLVSLYAELFQDAKAGKPDETVRQTIARANMRGMFLAPLGRQHTEYLGPMIERELDVADRLRMLPKMPPILKEAKGEFNTQTVWCGPLARAAMGQSIQGYMETVEFAENVAQQTGDTSIMDVFDFDVAFPEMAEAKFVPAHWMADPKKISAKRQGRAQQAAREQQVKELPGRAAMAKAQAITAKAATGGNTGGTLSGVPTGQMPMLPGQAAPGGRAFGQPGPQ
jgi:Bacteriophage head to tail connecting protein